MRYKKELHTNLHAMVLVALALLLPLLLVSCGGNEPDGGGNAPDKACMAGFYITTGNGTGGRAPLEGEYEAGTAMENLIDLENADFRILLFDSSDTYIGRLDNAAVTLVSTDGLNKTYRVDGTMPGEIVAAATDIKLMVLANWRNNYPELTAGTSRIADVSTASVARFDFGADDHIGPGKLIPMFGVSNLITGLEYTPGWTTDLGTLHLLRAYAKVRVRADSEGLDITSAKLTNAHDALMRAPEGVSRHDDYVGDSYAADYYHKVSVPEGAGIVSGLEFHKDDSGDWVIYLPEFANVDGGHADRPLDARDRCRIEVMFEGESSPQYVDFKYYDTPPAYAEGFRKGDHFDVLRNNIYDFTLCRLEGEKELSVEVDVIPYGEVLLAPDYGLERDENTGWIIIDSYDERYYYADKDYQYYNKDRQPIATRVEMTPDRKRYIVRWPRTKEVMYSFDPLTEKYYTDYEGTDPLVSPMQLARFFNSMIDNGKTYLVLRTDKFGKIMYLWDVSAGVCLDENMNRHTPTINHGYQLYKGVDIGVGSSVIVIGIDSDGRYRFFYDPATGKYYRDASGNDNISIMETEAFPPIQ